MYKLYVNSVLIAKYEYANEAIDAFYDACKRAEGCIELMHPDGSLDMYRPF